MAKIVLDRPGVPTIIGQLVAARVAQHMAADLERETRCLSSPRNHALVTCHAQGRHALRNEQSRAGLPLPLQAAQGAEFAPTERVDAGRPALGAAHMQLAGPEIDVIPAQGDKLAGAQPVPLSANLPTRRLGDSRDLQTGGGVIRDGKRRGVCHGPSGAG